MKKTQFLAAAHMLLLFGAIGSGDALFESGASGYLILAATVIITATYAWRN